jgi:hypothetical protein
MAGMRSDFPTLGAFFDDSGTHASAPFTVMGGLLGTAEQWDTFEAAWVSRLASPLPGKPPLSQFHLSPCRAGQDEFSDYTLAERDSVTYLFRRIILDNGFVTLAAAVNRIAWNEIIVGDIAEQIGGPEELCFYKCIELMVNTIRFRKPGHRCAVYFDQALKDKLQWWAEAYRLQSDTFPEIAGISFAPVGKVVALQGADMIATETYQYAKEWGREGPQAVPNAHFKEYINRELTAGLVFDRAQIEEVAARARTSSYSITSK